MAVLKSLISLGLSLMYGASVILSIMRMIFKNGYAKVLGKKHIEKPAVIDDPTWGIHGILHLEDVRIHYVASGPEDKPLMLFLHGFPEFWFSWRHQLKEFEKDYRVVAIDMRGYGDSDKPAGIEPYAIPHLISDIKQVILALGYKSCVLVAHDMGGAVAWAFGHFHAEMVDRLIVMNCPPQSVFKQLLETNKQQQKMSWYIFLFQLPFLPEIFVRLNNFAMFDQCFGPSGSAGGSTAPSDVQLENSTQILDAYKYTFSQPGAITPAINYYRAAFRYQSQKTLDLEYTMPVLLIWGMKDFALHSDTVTLTQKANPKIAVKTIPAAGHFVQNDCPEETNAAMREWLTEQQGKDTESKL